MAALRRRRLDCHPPIIVPQFFACFAGAPAPEFAQAPFFRGSIMAHLYQRNGGIYYIEWRDELGKHHKKSTRTANRIAAERLLKEHDAGAIPTHKQANLPLEHHVKDFIAAMQATTKPQQWQNAKSEIERIIAAIGCTKIEHLTPAKVISVVGSFRKRNPRYVQKKGNRDGITPDTDKPLSVTTKKSYLKSIRHFTRWLVAERRYPHDVLSGLDLRRVLKQWISDDDVGVTTRNRYTDEEIQKLLAFVECDTRVIKGLSPADRYRAYRIAANTGLRRLELSRMTPGWFDLDTGKLVIPAGKSKAKRSDTVVLPDDFVAWLRTWLPSLPARQEILPRLRAVNTAAVLRKDLERAGLPTMRDGEALDFHCLRHTFCSRLWEAGLALPEAKQQSRHATAEMILRYSHVDHDQIKRKLGDGL